MRKTGGKVHRRLTFIRAAFIIKLMILYYTKVCASSVQIIQFGESPNPTKLSKQSVHSLGAEAVR